MYNESSYQSALELVTIASLNLDSPCGYAKTTFLLPHFKGDREEALHRKVMEQDAA